MTATAERCPACGQPRDAEARARTFELGMLAGLLALGLDRATADRVGDRMRVVAGVPGSVRGAALRARSGHNGARAADVSGRMRQNP